MTNPASVDIPIGTYCLGTQFSDGDASGLWAIGFYQGNRDGMHFLAHEKGSEAPYAFRWCEPITKEQGAYIIAHHEVLEESGFKLWDYIHLTTPGHVEPTNKHDHAKLQKVADCARDILAHGDLQCLESAPERKKREDALREALNLLYRGE